MKKPVRWILIADGSRAKFYKAAGKHRLEEKDEMAETHLPTRELVSDRPGRTFDSAGQGRHAKEPPTDAHEKAEAEFLRAVAKRLDAACQQKEFDQLIVIAAPRALGVLRRILPSNVMDAVTREVSHDLTGFTAPALEAYLREHEII
jgi:protein required for attachment to host cells